MLQMVEIKSEIEKLTQQRLSLFRLSQELRKLGFKEDTYEINGNNQRLFSVVRMTEDEQKEIRKGENLNCEKVSQLGF